MRTTPTPRSRAAATYRRTTPACLPPSADVGSSRMSTRAPKWTARAMATDCRSPPESVPTGWSGSRMSMPHVVERPAGGPARLAGVEPAEGAPAAGGLATEEEVPPDRHQRDHRQVVVDGSDPG